ncbi:MAG: hypothetical protein K8L99_15260 [Anaerolineae bacterium]|nr:hypothetical protein [Anaerolineae bacterium]
MSDDREKPGSQAPRSAGAPTATAGPDVARSRDRDQHAVQVVVSGHAVCDPVSPSQE